MRKVADQDLIGALVMFLIGGVSISAMGSNMRDWAFPHVLTYTIISVGGLLLLRFLYRVTRRLTPHSVIATGQGARVLDVAVFTATVLIYLAVINGMGFWVASFLMLVFASVYLTTRQSLKKVAVAVVVAAAVCLVAYAVFLHLFYVPLPSPTWW